MSNNNSGSGCGCITFIAGVLFLWALLFGITIGGTHYGLGSCTTEHGVEINK